MEGGDLRKQAENDQNLQLLMRSVELYHDYNGAIYYLPTHYVVNNSSEELWVYPGIPCEALRLISDPSDEMFLSRSGGSGLQVTGREGRKN